MINLSGKLKEAETKKIKESKGIQIYNYDKLNGLTANLIMSDYFVLNGRLKVKVSSMNIEVIKDSTCRAFIDTEKIISAFVYETPQGVDVVMDLKREYTRITIRFGKDVKIEDLI